MHQSIDIAVQSTSHCPSTLQGCWLRLLLPSHLVVEVLNALAVVTGLQVTPPANVVAITIGHHRLDVVLQHELPHNCLLICIIWPAVCHHKEAQLFALKQVCVGCFGSNKAPAQTTTVCGLRIVSCRQQW